ncbi:MULTISPECIES: hypothetical protein [Prochlorococcus]|uniref:hypothetical protein n=1 Tax=Prochlorococcus TaxID=1218 RepID=UPI000533B12A|nr:MULTISPECIES: hypothetical protein [Prochlorococcus]KGG12449.1 hypothetical protein EV05_1661 [Prochlorococcus sp. MIT 0601]
MNEFNLYALVAPAGQLTGNGQLRETVSERRNRKGADVPFWYLSPELVAKYKISESSSEAVVAEDPTAIDWLRLRFGGEIKPLNMEKSELLQNAMELPPAAEIRDISMLN